MALASQVIFGGDREPKLSAFPESPGVFRLDFATGTPYYGRAANLRRRLGRLLGAEKGSRWAAVREAVVEARFEATGSPFESSLALYRLAREVHPTSYRTRLRLKPPPFVKVLLTNPYPRTCVTQRLTASRALFFGPFPTRSAAERFESSFLDLFLIRRCQEEIRPDPAHPGCIYGEMSMCLRPCQGRSTIEEYRGEVGRVLDFLSTRGHSLTREIERARDDEAAALEFERAARHHRRLDKVREAIKLAVEPARDVDRFFGIIVQPSTAPEAVELFWIHQGFLQPKATFVYGAGKERSAPLDSRLRALFEKIRFVNGNTQERIDHMALFHRWRRSSWRQGEALLFDGLDRIPYRGLVRAISRVAGKTAGLAQGNSTGRTKLTASTSII